MKFILKPNLAFLFQLYLKGLTFADIIEKCNVSKQALTQWVSGKTKPSNERLELLSNMGIKYEQKSYKGLEPCELFYLYTVSSIKELKVENRLSYKKKTLSDLEKLLGLDREIIKKIKVSNNVLKIYSNLLKEKTGVSFD